MISIVVVSHSRALAAAAVELALQMAPEDRAPAVEVAAGLEHQESVLGTDAEAVAQAMTMAAERSEGAGVLVLVDLGSALLSAEMALELVDPAVASQVRISPAPLVEGLVAAVATAAAGGDLETAAAEARSGLQPKLAQLAPTLLPPAPARDDGTAGAGVPAQTDTTEVRSVELAVGGEHGLHARPAARVVACVARVAPETTVRLTNLTAERGPVDALSLSAVATLDAQRGHVLLAEASGPLAQEVLVELVDLAAQDFGDLPAPAQPLAATERMDPASSAEPGVAGSGLEAAIGEVVLAGIELDVSDAVAGSAEEEMASWRSAVDQALARLAELGERARRHLGQGQAEVFDAHALLLQDPVLHEQVERRVGEGISAASAWEATIEDAAGRFTALADSYQRERSMDVRSVGERVLRLLLGKEEPEHLRGGILVVDELDPALAISLDASVVTGVITRRGGATGHGVLIATSRGVPVLTGAGATVDVPEGTLVAFDARSGDLFVDPAEDQLQAVQELLERRRAERSRALAQALDPVQTQDGQALAVRANVASVAEARVAARAGAQGCGLVRTEAVFGQWRTAPTVQQQVEVYTAIAEVVAPHPVAIRTWDVGGDKPLLFVPSEQEANPFLGARGVRAFAADPQILLDQLEAVCRVASAHPVQVLFPMVTTKDDVTTARELLAQAAERAGLPTVPAQLQVGIMIEVPAAAIQADVLAAGLDFVSIGTNDLSQYTLASERGNTRLARWSDHLEPSVLRLIRHVCRTAPEGVPVGVCGTMASEPNLACLLAGLGVTELSASASAVPLVKERLRGASIASCRELADRAAAAVDAEEVRGLVSARPAVGTAR